jgi:hypothetical protein
MDDEAELLQAARDAYRRCDWPGARPSAPSYRAVRSHRAGGQTDDRRHAGQGRAGDRHHRRGAGLGAAWGQQLARTLLAEAGFGEVTVYEAPGDPLNAVFVTSRPEA